MKRVSDKPKRKNYPNSTAYQRALKQWQRWQVRKYCDTDPSLLSGALLSTLLSEHGILQSGCRELQEYRLRTFRNGGNYRRSGDNRPNLTKSPRFQYACNDRFVLGLPKVVWCEVILKYLNVETLFQLLRVCKTFYALADAELTHVARGTIAHLRATPFALQMVLIIQGCPYNHLKAQRLKLPLRLVRQKDPIELVRLAIERHGYADHLLYYQEWMDRMLVAEAEEEFFKMRKMPERVKEVNDALKSAGHCFTISSTFDELLDATCDLPRLEELRAYTHMQKTRPLATIVSDLKHPVVYLTLQTCSLREIHDRFSLSYLLGILSRQTLTDVEIADYTLSIYDLVQQTHPDTEGYCHWQAGTVQLIEEQTGEPYIYHHSYHFTGP